MAGRSAGIEKESNYVQSEKMNNLGSYPVRMLILMCPLMKLDDRIKCIKRIDTKNTIKFQAWPDKF